MNTVLFSPDEMMQTIQPEHNAVTKQFVLAGKAIFTVELDSAFAAERGHKAHYTYKVIRKAAKGKYPEKWFASYLTGPDNTKSYSYIGVLEAEPGEVRLTEKSKVNEKSFVYLLLNRTLKLIWNDDITPMLDKGFKLHHEGRCCRCGRTLTVPLSITTGIGPECYKHMTGNSYPHISVEGTLE